MHQLIVVCTMVVDCIVGCVYASPPAEPGRLLDLRVAELLACVPRASCAPESHGITVAPAVAQSERVAMCMHLRQHPLTVNLCCLQVHADALDG